MPCLLMRVPCLLDKLYNPNPSNSFNRGQKILASAD